MTTESGEVLIRPATEADAEVIKQTIKAAGLDRTGLDWRRFKLAVAPEGEVLGMCQVRRYWDTRELGSLWVRKDFRKRGLGGMLIRACLAEEIPPVHLECVEARQPYYEQHGFVRIPVLQAPRGLRFKSAIGGTLAGVFFRQRIIVMRWNGAEVISSGSSPTVLTDQGNERDR